MSLLSSILFNNKNKPQYNKVSKAVKIQQQKEKNQKLDKKRNAAKKNWNIIYSKKGSVDPIGTAITNNAKKMRQNSANNDTSSGGGSYGGGLYGDGSSDGGLYDESASGGSDGTTDNAVKSSMTKAERNAIYNMKDSNVPYYYTANEDDLMYMAASEQQNSYWQFKEEVFIYSIHDRLKHRYFTSLQIDSDKNDIVTTCQFDMPYDSKLMEYWIPGKTAFMIMGGVFDREVLFIGRVSEVNQIGDTIQVVGQNIGWKFKQYMSDSFYKKIQGLPVPMVVKAIFKELGFTEGKYHMDLWAIPNVFKYKLDEDATIKYEGETVQNVPELTDVVSRMKDADINQYVATQAKVRDTQTVADDYNKKVSLSTLDSVVDSSKKYYPTFYRKNYGVSTTLKDGTISYDPIEDRLFGSNKSADYLTVDKSGDGEYTYETVLHNIASAIDAHFYIVDTTVCFVSFNALMAMGSSEAIHKAIQPRIEFWQLLHDSYELDINQYGYYNTVIIKYKNGVLKRAYDDLVRVYGEVPITYEEPELNYEAAQLKAQAYLAAHVRDFGMEIRATILYSGKITVSSFIKLLNPLTMSETLLYVFGTSIKWDSSGQTLTCDLDLRYGPENPDNPEVPEMGASYVTSSSNGAVNIVGNVSANISEAANQMIGNYTDNDDKVLAIYNWVDNNIKYEFYWSHKYSDSEMLTKKRGNCYDTAYLIYNLCTAVGIKCEVWNGTYHFLNGNIGHLWNKIYYKGKMTFADTGRSMKNPIGQHGSGRYIVSGHCVAKNY